MDSIRQFWNETMQIEEARWVAAAFGLITCVLVAYYFVKLFRDMALGENNEPISHLTEFERLHRKGKLNSEEYNKLKKTIPKNMLPKNQTELSQDKESAPDFREVKGTDQIDTSE